jgi:hypothetical protein
MLAGMWPRIAEASELRVAGPVAEAALLGGWLRSRLGCELALVHEEAGEVELVAVDGEACRAPAEQASPSDLLSAELDVFGRDPVYEAAAVAAS